ncbi:MAG: hypothetical protein KJ601_05725 [Nanoarchaeota archaeon]|nr:hypothetical protein [Nanoarchaeota archaeon]MBU1703869.1 hypothetical protein [Nanoarchaeota archaeon]
MKITIDTKEDSHEDIRKVIAMLNHLVSGSDQPSYSNKPVNIFENPSAFGESAKPAEGNVFGGMFESPVQITPVEKPNYEPEEIKHENTVIDLVPY